MGPSPGLAPSPRSLTDRALLALDRFLHVYHHRPLGRLREFALARAERWVADRQEADGGWGGIQPPWVYSLMALHLRGYPLDHPAIKLGLEGLESVHDPGATAVRRLEACQSPVWDTALALVALADAGVPGDDPAVVAAADWLLDEEITGRGDWAVRRPQLPAGGWAFEFANVNYPDVDDTAEVVLGLLTVDHPEPERLRAAIDRAMVWLEGMQSSNGGWAAFDADNCRELIRDLPFCDFGEVIDPPSADVTAHALEMLAALDRAGGLPAQRGLEWLLRGPGAGRLLVRTLGRQPRLRDGRRRSGADRRRRRSGLRADPTGGAAGLRPTRTRTVGGERTAAPTTTPTGSGGGRAPPPRPPGRCWPSTPRVSARPPWTGA